MTLLVFQRYSEASGSDKARRRERHTGTGKLRIQIDKDKGKVHFYTGNQAGVLEICKQSYIATRMNPRRIALHVTERAATSQEKLKNIAITDENEEEEKVPDNKQDNAILNVETSRISLELSRMEEKMHELASHAEHSKDTEQDFHLKQVRLHRAVRYWPIFRMVVVIIAGIVQTVFAFNHMKSRHIL